MCVAIAFRWLFAFGVNWVALLLVCFFGLFWHFIGSFRRSFIGLFVFVVFCFLKEI